MFRDIILTRMKKTIMHGFLSLAGRVVDTCECFGALPGEDRNRKSSSDILGEEHTLSFLTLTEERRERFVLVLSFEFCMAAAAVLSSGCW